MGTQNGTLVGTTQDSLVTGRTSQGNEIQARLLRLTRHAAVLESYIPGFVIRISEVLSDFKITTNGRTIYSGRAVIRNLIDSGTSQVCEVALEDFWIDIDGAMAGFPAFLKEWQRVYQVRPEFKIIVADMQTFLTDMRLWLEQIELDIRSLPTGDRLKREREIATGIGESTTPTLTNLFEKFESILATVDKELQPVHEVFARRQLHPLLLCSPFLYRTFAKPLGYAGDYEMVNMIMRDPFEGGSLYAKIINLWFWHQAPAEAHRNRIDYLTDQITAQAIRALKVKRKARVITLGCGPAHEVQRFLQKSPYSDQVEFTLLDFNPETLAHVENVFNALRNNQPRVSVNLVKKSVNQLLKESGKTIERSANEQYDLVYCAGLFDYLADPICRRLINVLYDWVAPDGLLIATNVDTSNPRTITMDYIMEWRLIYRSGAQLFALKPDAAVEDICSVKSDTTGVNVYLEARKPSRV
jgi:extracellular factor (EF) 3-hydroxypalmitic acid methyl ester biosynthesis protein